MNFYYTYDYPANEELLQIINIAVLTTADHVVIAEKLNMTAEETEKHILAAATLAAVKSGKAFKRTADKYGVNTRDITQIFNNNPYLKNLAFPPVKTNQELQQELQALTARFDKLVNDMNFAAILETDRLKVRNEQLQAENQQLLAQKATFTAMIDKLHQA